MSIITIIALIIGIMITGAGIYFLVKEKNDPESRKIYIITAIIGAVITAGSVIKMIFV